MSPTNNNTHDQRDLNFAAYLMGQTTEQTAQRQGLSAGAAKVAGIAIGGLVIAGIAIGPSTIMAAIQTAARIW